MRSLLSRHANYDILDLRTGRYRDDRFYGIFYGYTTVFTPQKGNLIITSDNGTPYPFAGKVPVKMAEVIEKSMKHENHSFVRFSRSKTTHIIMKNGKGATIMRISLSKSSGQKKYLTYNLDSLDIVRTKSINHEGTTLPFSLTNSLNMKEKIDK